VAWEVHEAKPGLGMAGCDREKGWQIAQCVWPPHCMVRPARPQGSSASLTHGPPSLLRCLQLHTPHKPLPVSTAALTLPGSLLQQCWVATAGSAGSVTRVLPTAAPSSPQC